MFLFIIIRTVLTLIVCTVWLLDNKQFNIYCKDFFTKKNMIRHWQYFKN
jgi:hypothetical protein